MSPMCPESAKAKVGDVQGNESIRAVPGPISYLSNNALAAQSKHDRVAVFKDSLKACHVTPWGFLTHCSGDVDAHPGSKRMLRNSHVCMSVIGLIYSLWHLHVFVCFFFAI